MTDGEEYKRKEFPRFPLDIETHLNGFLLAPLTCFFGENDFVIPVQKLPTQKKRGSLHRKLLGRYLTFSFPLFHANELLMAGSGSAITPPLFSCTFFILFLFFHKATQSLQTTGKRAQPASLHLFAIPGQINISRPVHTNRPDIFHPRRVTLPYRALHGFADVSCFSSCWSRWKRRGHVKWSWTQLKSFCFLKNFDDLLIWE